MEILRTTRMFIVMMVLLGLVYPLSITGISKLLFNKKASGSLIVSDNRIVGSMFIGQNFGDQRYFHSRPSALETPYDAANSGGSNFGPSNIKFLEEVAKRIRAVRTENLLNPSTLVPADLVLASASGLDPHISLESALLQASRVAQARGITEEEVRDLIHSHTEGPFLGIFGAKRLNVLRLNISIDRLNKPQVHEINRTPEKRG